MLRRRSGAVSKITWGANKRLPKMPAPDAIHKDARRQRILRTGNLPRKVDPSAPMGKRLPRFAAQDFEKLTWNLRTFVGGIATQEHAGINRALSVDQRHRAERSPGLSPVERLDVTLQ